MDNSIKGQGFSFFFCVVDGDVTVRHPSISMSKIRAEDKANVLIDTMNQLGYSTITIKADQWFLSVIRREFSMGESGMDRFLKYKRVYSKYSARRKYGPELSIVRRWMLFDLFDVLPSTKQMRAKGTNTVHDRLCPSFRLALDEYVQRAEVKGLKASTVRVEQGSLARFFLFLQEVEQVREVNMIMESSIRNYKVASRVSNAVMNRLGQMMTMIEAPCGRLFPGSRGAKKTVFKGIPRSEMEILKAYVHTSTDISLRDKAICLILMYFGPRCSDIRNLRMEHIHWADGYIAFPQSKTGQYVSYPLLPEIGDVIRRYIDEERPDCDLPYVFISEHRRGGQYACVSADRIVNGVYAKCGIRNGKVRKGTHIIRHALATALLEEGEDYSIITDVLGHTSVQSTMKYLSADVEALRRCSLDVAVFKVQAKVYDKDE